MLNPAFQPLFESILFETFGKEVELIDFSVAAAGQVNTGARIATEEGIFFLKFNELAEEDFFLAESRDLRQIGEFVPVPEVMGTGQTQGYNYLLTGWVEQGPPSPAATETAGRALAGLHRQIHTHFGHPYPNYLASVMQDNRWKEDGIDFLIQNRILPVVGLCLMEEKISLTLYKQIEAFAARMGRLIPEEPPALLHGDLWTGNLLYGGGAAFRFIDPAAHFGLRESELAFTHLFGGFPNRFYEAYLEEFPIEPGFGERIAVYHLHPLLVHVYLFGSSYIPAIQRILTRFS